MQKTCDVQVTLTNKNNYEPELEEIKKIIEKAMEDSCRVLDSLDLAFGTKCKISILKE